MFERHTMRLRALIEKLADMRGDLAPDDPEVTMIVGGIEHPLEEVWYDVTWPDGKRKVTVRVGFDPR